MTNMPDVFHDPYGKEYKRVDAGSYDLLIAFFPPARISLAQAESAWNACGRPSS
jgi:hypothetical protein